MALEVVGKTHPDGRDHVYSPPEREQRDGGEGDVPPRENCRLEHGGWRSWVFETAIQSGPSPPIFDAEPRPRFACQ